MPDAELLEVHDAAGNATGVAKTRAAVHRDGDWHLAFFCWIVGQGAGGALEVVLQKRAADRDVWPGRFVASAAGHVRFGESAVEAAREIDEELGIVAPPGALVPVMRHHHEHVHERTTRLVDREIHDVHLWRGSRASDAAIRVVRRWRAGSARDARCRGGSRKPPRSR